MSDTGITPMEAAPARRGAAVMLDVLRSQGVRHIFGNPGTTEMPLMHALAGAPDLAYVLGLQETAVVAMADGYAQATGRPAFVNIHTAGGLGNAMGALLHAQVARTPLVVTAGQQDTRHSFTDPILSGDLVSIARPAVKWAHEILHPEQIPALVRRAFQDSAAAPSGPVFLSLPIDMMERQTAVETGPVSQIRRAAVAEGLDELAEALAAVPPGRLALFAGDEVIRADAGVETVALAEALGARVYGSSWPGGMPFPTTHPLWAGNLPSSAAPMRAELEPYAAVLALGGNSLVTYLYSEGPALPPHCRLFQLSADLRELGRTYPTALACLGDLRASLSALLPLLGPKLAQQADAIAALRQVAVQDRQARLASLDARMAAERDRLPTTPFIAVGDILRAIGPDVAIVDEAPVTLYHIRSFLQRAWVPRYFFMRSAILGWGLPAAVGVSLGLGRAPVVALIGDGSSLYSPQALWTAARETLPVTFVVLNNREYNILKTYVGAQGYGEGANGAAIAGMDLTDPPIDFPALAKGFGLPARRIDRAADIAGAVEAGIASGRPNLIEVVIGAG